MAGRPKEERLLKTMRTLAQEELGAEGATPLDLACAMIGRGGTMRQVADRVSEALGETFSLDWFRWVLNRQPEGKERLRAAREMAAYALVNGATSISDEDRRQAERCSEAWPQSRDAIESPRPGRRFLVTR